MSTVELAKGLRLSQAKISQSAKGGRLIALENGVRSVSIAVVKIVAALSSVITTSAISLSVQKNLTWRPIDAMHTTSYI